MKDRYPDAVSHAVAVAGDTLQHICHAAARQAGWWDGVATYGLSGSKIDVPQKLMLIVSEIAEAMEGDRKTLMDDHLPHRQMMEVELADAVIRIMDLAGAMGFNLGDAIAEKLAYNEQRADHKPEARAAAGGKRY